MAPLDDGAPARKADHRLGSAIGRPERARQARARFDAAERRVEPPDLVEPLERHPAFAVRGIERHRFDVALRLALRRGAAERQHRDARIRYAPVSTERQPRPIAIVGNKLEPIGTEDRERRKSAEGTVRADEAPAAHEAERPGLPRWIAKRARADLLRGEIGRRKARLRSRHGVERDEDQGGEKEAAHRRGDRTRDRARQDASPPR